VSFQVVFRLRIDFTAILDQVALLGQVLAWLVAVWYLGVAYFAYGQVCT
jgi:hypothetical protein